MFEVEIGFLSRLLTIILIDLVLSGDNAVVIGMAARRLPSESRRRAILLGGFGAVILRVIFTAMAALLLDVPLLQAIGGLLLLWIAYKLVRPVDYMRPVSEAESLSQAVRTIILADFVMSLDNILAVGGAAHGHLGLLLFGLALSIPILLMGSELVARMLGRLPLLVYVGVIVLIITAVRMIFDDKIVHDVYKADHIEVALIATVASAAVIVLGRRAIQSEHPTLAKTKVDFNGSGP